VQTNATGFTFVEHTADVGIRATAGNLPDLFVQAAKGMYAVLGRLKPGPQRVDKVLELEAPDAEGLLHDWLAELLWEIDGNGNLFEAFEFTRFCERGLVARCHGSVFDAAGSERSTEVKAVTYHDLRIRKRGEVYEVTVIFDI
jgi:SHS2 domain-containing protein